MPLLLAIDTFPSLAIYFPHTAYWVAEVETRIVWGTTPPYRHCFFASLAPLPPPLASLFDTYKEGLCHL